jgi:glucosamine-6-phosphate deaminase
MNVKKFESPAQLGQHAAVQVAHALRARIASEGSAAAILATGNSQFAFLDALADQTDIAWDRVEILHMDEYLGMSETHPASFRRYMHERVVARLKPRAFHGVAGDAPDTSAELARYTALLQRLMPVVCVMGIGENGHLAFNDPPADFDTQALIHVVTLDAACRAQQVGEGHFATLEDVPARALSLTVRALLAPALVIAVVPEARKARAVQAALEGPLTAQCPASILRTGEHVHVLLDSASSALLSSHWQL